MQTENKTALIKVLLSKKNVENNYLQLQEKTKLFILIPSSCEIPVSGILLDNTISTTLPFSQKTFSTAQAFPQNVLMSLFFISFVQLEF